VFQSHHQWFLPPTIGIRASFVTKHKYFGRYTNFQSCQKQFLIIPQCRAHPYELTGAKISFIGARGDPHAPPEIPVTVAQSHPRAPEVEDECRPRAPYSSRSPTEPSLQPSRSLASAEPIEYSPEYSRFNPSEPPNVQNRFSDRFSLFQTHFHPSQAGSLLF